MRTFILTVLALTATCALGDETCDIDFINTGSSEQQDIITIIKGKNLDVIMTAGSEWSAFMANGPDDVIFRTQKGTEKVTDLEDASVEERLGMAHQVVKMMDYYGTKADYSFSNWRLKDNSPPHNGWTIFTRRQPWHPERSEYFAQNDGRELLLNVFESSGDYHHIFKNTNGLITVVKRDCSIVTYAKDDAGYAAILAEIEEITSSPHNGGWKQKSDKEEESHHLDSRFTGLAGLAALANQAGMKEGDLAEYFARHPFGQR